MQAWEDTLSDMFLQIRAHMVIARRSCFWSNPIATTCNSVYCEIMDLNSSNNQQVEDVDDKYHHVECNTKLQCYSSFLDWCCNYITWAYVTHHLRHDRVVNVSRKFVKFPKKYFEYKQRFRPIHLDSYYRPQQGNGTKGRRCLPHG